VRSNYKRLGDYIQEVNNRNKDLKVTNLLGINIDKFFMPSVANVIGTDMTNYKIVKKGNFACNRMHVGRDERLPISLSKSDEDFLVSPAYSVFEITDTNVLLPDYLMMWFCRAEFDRNAWFYTDADVRGGLNWKEFCDMQLPIPSPEKQKEIVKEYQVIENRIKLNNSLIQKLEETAQAIYKQWFVDFEFPDENGNPYKSSGGEMEFCNELEMEIPLGWGVGNLESIIDLFISNRGKSKSIMELMPKSEKHKYPVISAMNINSGKIVKHNTISYADKDSFNDWMKNPLFIDDVIMTSEAPMGELYFIAKRNDFILSQRLFAMRVNKKKSRGLFLYFWLQSPKAKEDLEGRASGTTVMGIKLSELKKTIILKPPIELLNKFEISIRSIMNLFPKSVRRYHPCRNRKLSIIIMCCTGCCLH